jgi:cytochrome o ubiquinol oxidase subunit III
MSAEIELKSDVKVFGFWIYLMTDLVIFAALFATYIVLRTSTFGGPSASTLFEMPAVLAETVILLVSSFTCALGMLAIRKLQKKNAIVWFAITFVLGALFLSIEIAEFAAFIAKGAGPSRSAFLSSFFTLVGTHGTHIAVGLLWMGVEMVRILIRPLSEQNVSKVFRMAIFWHFLDFVWIFVFTTVYGMGHLL